MKRILFSLAALVMLTASCNKRGCEEPTIRPMTVIRDCTGTYLRVDGKDYNVCNLDAVAAYADGATIDARFKQIADCPEAADRIVCYMLHENEGWVEVLSVH
jgi:hypothetical protein